MIRASLYWRPVLRPIPVQERVGAGPVHRSDPDLQPYVGCFEQVVHAADPAQVDGDMTRVADDVAGEPVLPGDVGAAVAL